MPKPQPAGERAPNRAPLDAAAGAAPRPPAAEPGNEDAGATAPGDPEVCEPPPVKEIGGPAGPEPTRYGDWERNGRCTDF